MSLFKDMLGLAEDVVKDMSETLDLVVDEFIGQVKDGTGIEIPGVLDTVGRIAAWKCIKTIAEKKLLELK
jgi:hypothetical protein